jgi:hypothetical protein
MLCGDGIRMDEAGVLADKDRKRGLLRQKHGLSRPTRRSRWQPLDARDILPALRAAIHINE